MYIYFIIFLFISVLALLESAGIHGIRKFSTISVFSILLLIAGFRYETGVDWIVYKYMFTKVEPIDKLFSSILSQGLFSMIDVGYAIFTSIIKSIGGGLQIIFFLTSLFNLITLFMCFRSYSPSVSGSILVYYATIFFVLDMSGMRQCIAMNIFFYSIQYLYNRNLFKYVLLILFAGSFHWSALFLLFLYPVVNRQYNNYVVTLFFISNIIIFFFKIRWLKNFLELSFPFINNKDLVQKAYVYTSTLAFASAREINLTSIVNVVYFIIIFLFCIVYRRVLTSRYPFFNLFFNLFLISTFLFLSASELIDISYRMQYYFMLSLTVLLPMLVSVFNAKLDRVILTTCIILYSLSYCKLYVFESRYTIAYHPYQNYIVYKVLDINSTGYQRLREHEKIHVKKGTINE